MNYLLFGGGTLFLAGLLCIGAAALNADIFFEHPTAQKFVQSMGRTGARIFYIVLGSAFAVIGGLMAARWLQIAAG